MFIPRSVWNPSNNLGTETKSLQAIFTPVKKASRERVFRDNLLKSHRVLILLSGSLSHSQAEFQ